MKFTFTDFVFLLGIILIIYPILVYNWYIGSVIAGVILVYLSLNVGQGNNKGGGK
ncbi:MAG: hypothetical protein L0K82_03800 [Pisciglobus halotolerans]|nr:hypothetical protein [Pisciglobus halotolerans]